MASLTIDDIQPTDNGYRVVWSTDDQTHTKVEPLDVAYGFPVNVDPFYAINTLLAFMLPTLAHEYGRVTISASSYNIDSKIKDYWSRVLHSLRLSAATIQWQPPGDNAKPLSPPKTPCPESGRLALLFGGGVESCFALSQLAPLKPILLSFLGPCFMNNDSRSYQIKEEIEDQMVNEQQVQFERVTTNGMALLNHDDTYKSNYVTGNIFYWLSLPLCRHIGAHTIFKASEMEEALNFQHRDISLRPTYLRNATFPGESIYLPLYNCYPKIQMLDELSKTPFIKYLYSCYHNSDQRWCGRCSKCYRISEFCKRLGIAHSEIGMQEGIVGKTDFGIAARSWTLADILYGKPSLAYRLGQLAAYRRIRGKKELLQYLVQLSSHKINAINPFANKPNTRIR